MNILVTYASPYGSTAEIAMFIGRGLRAYNVNVTVLHADVVQDVSKYHAFILGSAVHSSMWLPSLTQFMFRFEKQLAEKPIFLFLACIAVLEPGGFDKAITQYVWDVALEKLNIKQNNIYAFAGKLNLEKITGHEEWVLKANYQGKKLSEVDSGDYRDWEEIARWTHTVAKRLSLSPCVSDDETIIKKTKDETITTQEVKQLKWIDNPGEMAGI